MGWNFSLDGVELAEEDLTAGQLEALFLLVNSELVHNEAVIGAGPFGHCPVCRVAIGALALASATGLGFEGAGELIRSLGSLELAEAFVPGVD